MLKSLIANTSHIFFFGGKYFGFFYALSKLINDFWIVPFNTFVHNF